MAFVLEITLEPNHMLLVLRISLRQLLENLNFFNPCFLPVLALARVARFMREKYSHCLIVTNQLDSH